MTPVPRWVGAVPDWRGIPCRIGRVEMWLPVADTLGLRPFSLLALLPERDPSEWLPYVLLGVQFLLEYAVTVTLDCSGPPGSGRLLIDGLAGHSTPTRTARYTHCRLHDLSGAVEKQPRILPDEPTEEALGATGTEPALARTPGPEVCWSVHLSPSATSGGQPLWRDPADNHCGA